MITISNLKKQFGETVACDIEQLTINDGDILGLVGNNGAGKTTLFRLLLDLLQPDGGSVLIDNINPAQSEDWKQSVGAYIDEGFLIDFLTPEEYFAFLGKVSGMTQTEVDERLKDFEQFAAGEVFGQKKLIRNFLDPSSQLILKHVLTDYAKETGATLIISSHNLQHTVDISTRVVLLEHGVVIRDLPNQDASAAAELEAYFER